MSYGNIPRSSRSGGKGAAPKKSGKKRKQEFHKHRQQQQRETETLSTEQAKARAIASLEKLGHQKLSTEPGGYDLQSWLKSLNMLLDDLQERMGETGLPPEYYKKREEAERGILLAGDLSEIDRTIASLFAEANEAQAALEGERNRIHARLEEIDLENNRLAKEMENVRSAQEGQDGDEKSTSFFGRLLGRDKHQREAAEEKLEESQSMLKTLEDEASVLRADLERLDSAREGSPAQKLAVAKSRIGEAQSRREQTMQLSQEREALTSELIGLISGASTVGQSPVTPAGSKGPGPR